MNLRENIIEYLKSHPVASSSDIADSLSTPRGRISEALNLLKKHGEIVFQKVKLKEEKAQYAYALKFLNGKSLEPHRISSGQCEFMNGDSVYLELCENCEYNGGRCWAPYMIRRRDFGTS